MYMAIRGTQAAVVVLLVAAISLGQPNPNQTSATALRSATNQLAKAMIAAKTAEERAGLLASKQELMKPQLVTELIREGNGFSGKEQYVEAARIYEMARALAEQIDDRPGMAGAALEIGRDHLSQGDAAKAGESFRESLEISRRFQDGDGTVRALINLGFLETTPDRKSTRLNS